MELLPETAVAEQHISPLSAGIDQLEGQVTRAEVSDDDSLSKAGDLYKIIGSQEKKSEDARKKLVQPLNLHVKWINNQFKPLTERLKLIKNSLKGKMDIFVAEKTRIEQEQAEAARKAAEEEALQRAAELEKQGQAEVADKVIEAAAELPSTVPKSAPARGDYGSTTSARTDWKAEIVDIKAFLQAIIDGHIPEDYIEIKQSKLNSLATAKKVEKTNFGIKIFKTVSASIR